MILVFNYIGWFIGWSVLHLGQKVSSAEYLLMTPDMTSYYPGPDYYKKEKLARLVFILVTPDPPTGTSRTSTGSTYNALCGTITKDALLLLLEGIVQSSDAFPPLKSAASGLLFLATCADVSIRRNAR